MSHEYLRLLAAFYTLLGRSQQSRRDGNPRRSLNQLNAATRIYDRMTRLKN